MVDHNVEWDEAMSWWRGQSETIRRLISRVVSDRMVAEGAEEIGTSDLNCGVFSMYKEYKAANCPEVITFLIEYSGC